ncbi:MAG: sodium:alanine symporter family protein [Bacillota bacterium]|nr:sodium:alanine symporter family protein [Bacillota bacterium]
MDQFLKHLKWVNSEILWGWPTIILLLGTGVFFTFATRFIQVRKMGMAFKETFGSVFSKESRKKGEVSSFQSLATAIAAQVGTGNLAGVASAIASGGPGAVFWMWVSGFFGMGTIFAEAVVSQRFVKEVDGERIGGPAYYIRYGIKNQALAKFLAGFFAISIIIALGFMGNIVQANSIASSINTAFGVPQVVTGIVVAVLVLLIVGGGVQRIVGFTSSVVPFMAIFYIGGSLAIILMNFAHVGEAFSMIFKSAFSAQAFVGGAIGTSVKAAFRYGVARGLFSNEAGMGSTPHAHAIAKVDHPAEQGLVATLGVLIDTGIVCTMTALVILTTGTYSKVAQGLEAAELTQAAFTAGIGGFGNAFVAICLFFFAFSTIIGWYFFGETNVKYLFGRSMLWPYRLLVALVVVAGSMFKVGLVWELADSANFLIVLPNLIALLALAGLVTKILRDYENNFLRGTSSEYQNKK